MERKTKSSQKITSKKPRLIAFDLEVSAALGWFYPPTWETRILKTQERQKLMSLAWQVVGEKKIDALCLYDMPGYKENPRDDRELVIKLHEAMSSADILLTQNGDNFDIKMANYFFIMNDLTPVPPTKSIDTKKIAKRYFRFMNNTLDNLGEELGVGGKTDVKHSDIWYDCYVKGDKAAWRQMNIYCSRDVEVTTKIYLKMRGFMRSHPNMARLAGDFDCCPGCGGFSYRVRAYRHTNSSRYVQYSCNDCEIFFSDRTPDNTVQKPRFVVA
jgi:DNA polymerase elongation subunit (family B)